MKKIEIKNTYTIQAPNTEWNVLDIEELKKRMGDVGENKLLIIENAYSIESKLESIITYYFFGRHEINMERKRIFEGQILRSNWCSFEAKRKLIKFIVDDLAIFPTKKEAGEYEKALRKVMSYRNAFTHGQLTNVGEKVKLTWFEGITRNEFLTDEFLTKIETDFLKCKELTNKIAIQIGETTIVKSLDEPLTEGQTIEIKIKPKD